MSQPCNEEEKKNIFAMFPIDPILVLGDKLSRVKIKNRACSILLTNNLSKEKASEREHVKMLNTFKSR